MISKLKLYKGNNVIVYFSKKGKEIRHYTGVIIEPDCIDLDTGAIKPKGKYKDLAVELTKRINLEKSKIDNLILTAPLGVELISYIKDKLNETDAVEVKEGEKLTKPLLDYYSDFYSFKEKEVKRGKIKLQSIKDYKSLQNALTDYTTYNRNWNKRYKIMLDNINEDWLYEFVDFLREKRENTEDVKYLTKGGLNDTTICKRIDSFKAFYSFLADQKICFKNDYLEKFSISRTETDIIVINEEEEKAIIDYLPTCTNVEHSLVLKMALVLCNTGMRFSDAQSFNKRLHIKTVKYTNADGTVTNRKVIGKVAEKSKTSKNKKGIYFEVPLNATAEKYLKELDYKLDYFKYIQDYNDKIKLALKEIPIFNEPYQLESTGEYFPKYQLISSHNFRKSFITKCVLANIPVHIIMGFTSHKKLDTLMVYIRKFGHNSNFTFVDNI